MKHIEPKDSRATRLHLTAEVGGQHDLRPGEEGTFRTVCGRDLLARVLTAGDEPSLWLCSQCNSGSERGEPK